MNWLESLIYGLISGFSEFMPISSKAHQDLLLVIFGANGHDPIRDMLVHIAMLLSIYSGCRSMLEQLKREATARVHNRFVRNKSARLFDLQFVKNATLPLIVGTLIFSYIVGKSQSLLWTALFLMINGILLFIPERMIRANRDARTMSYFDSILFGIFGALSAVPGFSRMACSSSVAIARGAAPRKALDWALLLSIPAIILFVGIDFIGIFTFAEINMFWSNILGYILSAIGTYIGGYLAILLMKFLAERNGFYDVSYYCWGASLISFILYLTVV